MPSGMIASQRDATHSSRMRGSPIVRRLGCAFATALLLAVLAGYGDAWHPSFAVAADFRLHLAIIAAALGLLAALLAQPLASVTAFVAAFVGAVGLGPVYTQVERPGEGRAVTLLYANLWNENPAPDRLRAALRIIDADILITSETTATVARSADGLRAHYPHRLAGAAGGTTLRTAIWSKFPLRRGELYLDNTRAPTGAAAVVDLGDGLRLSVIGVHFSRAHEGLRQVQADALGPIAGSLPLPVVIAGDFNSAVWSWVVSRAAAVTGTRIVGGYRTTWQGSYPTPLGRVPAPWGHQIDHVLVSRGVEVATISTVPLPGSDHRGVLVRLRIAPG